MLEVVGLRKAYNGTEVLKGISFTVNAGQVLGFLGPNGAGKTTTMNIITGLIGYDCGTITIDGHDLREHRDKVRRILGYLPENPCFYGYMTAREYLGFIGSLGGMSPGGQLQEEMSFCPWLAWPIQGGKPYPGSREG